MKKINWVLIRNLGSVTLLVILFILSFFYVKKNIHFFQDWQSLKLSYLLVLIILNFIYILLQGLILKEILIPFKIILSFKEWFGISMITLMGNYLIPFGGLGFRAAYLKKKYNFNYTYFISTLGVITMIQFLIFTFGGLLALGVRYFQNGTFNLGLSLFFIFMMVFCTVVLFLKIQIPKSRYQLINRLAGILDNWNILRKNKKLTEVLFRLNFWIFIASSLIFYFSFRAFNFNISFIDAFIPACLSAYSLFIRILPASIGAYEGAVVIAANFFGFTAHQGLIVTALTRITIIVWVFSLGPIFSFILMRKNNTGGIIKWFSGKL